MLEALIRIGSDQLAILISQAALKETSIKLSPAKVAKVLGMTTTALEARSITRSSGIRIKRTTEIWKGRLARVAFCVVRMTSEWYLNCRMVSPRGHSLILTALRVPRKYIEYLKEIKRIKHRNDVSLSYLMRTAIAEFIERELGRKP